MAYECNLYIHLVNERNSARLMSAYVAAEEVNGKEHSLIY